MIFLISPGLGEEVKEEVACNERKEGDENWEEDVHCAGNLLVRYLGHSSSLKHMERLSCQFQYRFQHGIFWQNPFYISSSESHILPLPSIPCTMHIICLDTTMLTEMECEGVRLHLLCWNERLWPAQRLQRFFKLTTKNSYLSTTYCIKLSSHTVQ